MKYKFLSFLTSWSEFASLVIVQEKMQHRRKKKILQQSEISIKLDLAEIEVPRLLFKREFSSHWMSVVFRFGNGVASGLREMMGFSPLGVPPWLPAFLNDSSALLCWMVWLSGVHAWVHPQVCTGANRPNRVSNKECYLNKFVIYVTCFKVLAFSQYQSFLGERI